MPWCMTPLHSHTEHGSDIARWGLTMDHLILLFRALWNADERPEARRFTIGCFVVLLFVIALFGLFYASMG